MFPAQHGGARRTWTLKLWALSRKSGDLESSAGTVVREVFLEDEGQYLTGDLKDEGVGSSHVQRGRSSREKERNPQEALRILHKAEGVG